VLESPDFLPLPSKFDIHEWAIMRDFTEDRSETRERAELLDAIHGAGAFRNFRRAIRLLRIEEEWYRFRQSALEELARDWLEDLGIPFR